MITETQGWIQLPTNTRFFYINSGLRLLTLNIVCVLKRTININKTQHFHFPTHNEQPVMWKNVFVNFQQMCFDGWFSICQRQVGHTTRLSQCQSSNHPITRCHCHPDCHSGQVTDSESRRTNVKRELRPLLLLLLSLSPCSTGSTCQSQSRSVSPGRLWRTRNVAIEGLPFVPKNPQTGIPSLPLLSPIPSTTTEWR